MGDIFDVTDFITTYIFNNEQLSLDRINNDWLKHCLFEWNSELKQPHPVSFTGQWASQYLSAISLNTLIGVAQWIQFLGSIQNNMYSLSELDWFTLDAISRSERVNYSSWMIPCLRIIRGPNSTSVETCFVNASEYITRNQLTSLGDFIKDIIEIALFGVPFRRGIVGTEGLNLDDCGAYAASRLFQGVVEEIFQPGMTWLPSFISVFIDDRIVRQLESEFPDDLLMKIDAQRKNIVSYAKADAYKRSKIEQDIEAMSTEVLMATHWYLGNNDDIVLLLDSKVRFSGLYAEYINYVKRFKLGSTMGFQLWKAVCCATPRFKQLNQIHDGDQTQDMWWNKIISTTTSV